MPLLGSHVLMICHDFSYEDERDFNEWYIREHMPERVALPGFNRGRRFQSFGEGPKYLAFYEVTDAGALSSEAYLKLIRNFDPRSRQFVPRFQSAARTVSAVRHSVGLGDGGVIGLIGFEVGKSDVQSLRGGGGASLTSNLIKRAGLASAHLLEADEAVLTNSRRGHLRQNDLILPWTLLVEAIDDAALAPALAEFRGALGLSTLCAGKVLIYGRYRSIFGLGATNPLKVSV